VPSREEVLVQLSAILESRWLRESHQLQAFLEYITQESLEHREDGLKEYLIGCRVFGRKPDYDPRHDAIVRVQASVLRKKLDGYYKDEGSADKVIIDLPRGGYVPVFSRRSEALEILPEVVPVQVLPPARARSFSKTALFIAFLAGCALTGLAIWGLSGRTNIADGASPDDCPQLWAAFFEPGASNMVSFGVPLFYSGDGLYFRDVRVNTPGEERFGKIAEFADLIRRSPVPTDDLYTGVGEAQGVNLVSNFFARRGMPVKLANARSLGVSNLAGQNLVIVSSLRFQTLLQNLHLPEALVFDSDKSGSIVVAHPVAGERARYAFESGAGVSTSYALVSVWPASTRGRRIMHVGGVHTWATQAATEFILNPQKLREMARHFKEKPGTPFFQILLRVEARGNQFQSVEYVTHHYLQMKDEPIQQ
jgi:hypothetical protein